MKKLLCKAISIILSTVMLLGSTAAFAAEPIKDGWDAEKAHYYIDYAEVKSNFVKDNDGANYYFDENGLKVIGIKNINNNIYYFDDNGIMQTGWKTYNSETYYFTESGEKIGQAVTGFRKINKYYYFFSKSGKMQTGWKKYKNNKYFFYKDTNKKGRAATGKVKIGKKTYKFSKSGKLINENAMDIKADNYSSPTKYLILVNKKTHRVGIYKGKKGNWKRIKDWKCTVGAPGTRTPSGNFLIGPSGGKPFHQRYFDSGRVRCWWATRITGGYNFHSVLYTQASKPNHVYNGRLGADLSHGCVRLKIQNAKWLYDNIPKNTRCIIY